MAEKGKRVLIEDSFSEDEELKGNNKNGFGITSALEDVDGAPEEMREKKKQKLAMPSSPDVENKPALLSENGVVELEPIADNVENDDVTNLSQSVEMAKDVEGTHILQLHYVPKAEDLSEVPIDVVPEETKGTGEDRLSDHNDNIDDKEEDKQGEASIGVKTMLMVEGELVFRNENMVLQKLLRAPRYFESADWEACYECGEDNHGGKCTLKKKRKPCYICGDLDHDGKRCNRIWHIAKDCPMDQPEKDRFCLKCGNCRHDIFSCTDVYCSEDLKGIQCYICKAFGHLCCFDEKMEGPRHVACFKCGELGHSGFECSKLNENANDMQSKSVCSKSGERSHPSEECIKSPEAAGLDYPENKDMATNPVNKKSAKTCKIKRKPEATVNVSRGSPNGNRG